MEEIGHQKHPYKIEVIFAQMEIFDFIPFG